MDASQPGLDPLGVLARSVGRPRESLVAFKSLSPEQLTLLSAAIDATAERRREQVDVVLRRALPRRLEKLADRLLDR